MLLVGCAYAIAERRASIPDVWSATMLHSTPALGDVFSTFGVLMFAFRCEVVGTQVHKEMKYPRHFNRAVYIGITGASYSCVTPAFLVSFKIALAPLSGGPSLCRLFR